MAAVQGMADYPFVVIAHPIASASDAELRARAEGSLAGIVALLRDPRRAG
jgi:hypothetical protein